VRPPPAIYIGRHTLVLFNFFVDLGREVHEDRVVAIPGNSFSFSCYLIIFRISLRESFSDSIWRKKLDDNQ